MYRWEEMLAFLQHKRNTMSLRQLGNYIGVSYGLIDMWLKGTVADPKLSAMEKVNARMIEENWGK